MTRTTINLEPAVLDALRERARDECRPIGSLASELLRLALAASKAKPQEEFRWIAKPMGRPRIDLSSNAAIWEFLDGDSLRGEADGTDD